MFLLKYNLWYTAITMQKETKIIEEAKSWVKVNKKEIIKRFIGDEVEPVEKPFTIFMAGSPGAGKTETSKRFISGFKEVNAESFVARIDPDDIRETIPGYDGSNSYLFQGAASLGVEKLYDYVLDKKINAVIDGTLAAYGVADKNISRSIKKNRDTSIFYIYQDPIKAWEFTKAREKVEGRNIPKEAFIESLFSAKDNVNKLKKIYGKKLTVFLIIKDFENNTEKSHFNISNVDNYLKINYTKQSLTKLLC